MRGIGGVVLAAALLPACTRIVPARQAPEPGARVRIHALEPRPFAVSYEDLMVHPTLRVISGAAESVRGDTVILRVWSGIDRNDGVWKPPPGARAVVILDASTSLYQVEIDRRTNGRIVLATLGVAGVALLVLALTLPET